MHFIIAEHPSACKLPPGAKELIDQKAQASSSCLNKLCLEVECRSAWWEWVLDGEVGRKHNDLKWIHQETSFFFLPQLLSFLFLFYGSVFPSQNGSSDLSFLSKRSHMERDFPGSPMAKSLNSQCRGAQVPSLVRELNLWCCKEDLACCE